MLVRNLDTIYDKVSTELNLPRELIKEVVLHYFTWFKKVLNNIEVPSVAWPFIGVVYLSKSQYYFSVRNLIRALRKRRTDWAEHKLNLLFKKRFDLYNYYYRNKLKGRKINDNK